VRDQFLASLADTRAEIAALAALLGTEAPEEPKSNAQSSSSSSSEGGRSGGQLNLTEQLAHLECHVDQLRSQKEVSFFQITVNFNVLNLLWFVSCSCFLRLCASSKQLAESVLCTRS
jgi:hypothetical protein